MVEPVQEAVARCLAQMDRGGPFISATDWEVAGPKYRKRAREILQTIENVREGNLTGGLPPKRPHVNFPDLILKGRIVAPKVISMHWTKAQAVTAASRLAVEAPKLGQSSGHGRVRYKHQPTGKRFGKRWKVVAE